MEHETLQRRSMATMKTMGVNTYSQIVSAFRAQGDLTDEKLDILPVLQNAFGISRERHTAEVKRALYDEQLSEIASSVNPSSNTTNWEAEANYAFPTVVHRPPNTESVRLAEEILQTTPPTMIIQHSKPTQTTKLNRDLQKLVRDELKHDGIINATQPQSNINTNRFTLPNFTNNDIQGSKVIRLVRAQQAPKRKTNLDTLIEVVQRELLRVNNQNSSHSPPESRSISSTKRSIIFPTNQSNHSFKLTRKRGMTNFNSTKRPSSYQQRHTSVNHADDEFETSFDEIPTGPENIDEIVRETVDRLVAMTLLSTAPYVVNMLTTIPTNTDSTSVSTNNYKSQMKTDFTIDRRNSPSQISPLKPQQQIHHPQLILQSTPTTTNTNSAVFVTPRILNFQTVVPKPTTNIQIGNTKIILVSPSTTSSTPQTASLANNSVKLVKFTTNNSQIPSTTVSTNSNTLTLPKNLQIVIPSQTPSSIQLTRTNHDETTKSLSTTTTTFRPVTTVPIGLKTCALDHIPQAAQEVTISTSPTPSPPLTTNTNELHQQTTTTTLDPNSLSTRASPSQDETIKSVSLNFPTQSSQIPRPTSTHGPMIFRMTSVNPNVPVFRVRATAPTTSPTVMNKSIKTEAKPISITPATNICYEPKPTHSTQASSGPVSVLACFKTTKKRNRERAIMPRPSTNESTEISSNNSNSSLIVNNEYLNTTSLSAVNSDEINQEQIMNDLAMISNTIRTNSKNSNEDKRLFDDVEEDDGEENWLIETENFFKNLFDKEYFQILDSNDQQFIRTKFDFIQTNLLNGNIPSKTELIQSILQFKPEQSNDNLNQFFTNIEYDLSKTSSDSKRLRQQ